MTQLVYDSILSIRDSGVTNMLDVNGVQRIAYNEGFYELVIYIEEDKKRYFHFILTGDLPEGEENPAATRSVVDKTAEKEVP